MKWIIYTHVVENPYCCDYFERVGARVFSRMSMLDLARD